MTFRGKGYNVILMTKVVNWIKANKLVFVLLLIIGYFVYTQYFIPLSYQLSEKFQRPGYYETGSGVSYPNLKTIPRTGGADSTMQYGTFQMNRPYSEPAPTTDVENRMVISNSDISLLVNDVVEVQNQIIQTTESLGGYMVNSNLNNPQDAPTANIVVRVPSDKMKEALDSFRGLAVKVISENLSGQDVTDQFVDNEARLSTLEQTKTIFEDMLVKATRIEDILRVQQEIINLQSQIDSLIGQQNYLEQNAKLARITIYLSTDELALPYSPSETWRPAVIFKQASRSLIGNLRKLGSAIIWLVVYSLIWLPILFIILYLIKRKTK